MLHEEPMSSQGDFLLPFRSPKIFIVFSNGSNTAQLSALGV